MIAYSASRSNYDEGVMTNVTADSLKQTSIFPGEYIQKRYDLGLEFIKQNAEDLAELLIE